MCRANTPALFATSYGVQLPHHAIFGRRPNPSNSDCHVVTR
ncbi:hypothetical protein CSPX01_06994 [Colletotrichum filicis]|nr:hypothetical protein CSPX01_06994 [Colletotrichum filicis]